MFSGLETLEAWNHETFSLLPEYQLGQGKSDKFARIIFG